jgi:hypothetical protein
MLFEHWIYSIAIAIIAGMIYYKFASREYSWIIIASAYVPDIDVVINDMLKKIGIIVLVYGHQIRHGDFHNIAVLLFFAVSTALILQTFGIRFMDSFIFASIGFGAHMFEDALVFNPAYSFFWPISSQIFGIGIFEYNRDWYGIADKEVLIVGLIAVIVCAIIRAAYEGKGWVKRMVPGCLPL